jgi:hypothetical protein
MRVGLTIGAIVGAVLARSTPELATGALVGIILVAGVLMAMMDGGS